MVQRNILPNELRLWKSCANVRHILCGLNLAKVYLLDGYVKVLRIVCLLVFLSNKTLDGLLHQFLVAIASGFQSGYCLVVGRSSPTLIGTVRAQLFCLLTYVAVWLPVFFEKCPVSFHHNFPVSCCAPPTVQ